MCDKFTIHKEKRINEIRQRMKNSKLQASKNYKY